MPNEGTLAGGQPTTETTPAVDSTTAAQPTPPVQTSDVNNQTPESQQTVPAEGNPGPVPQQTPSPGSEAGGQQTPPDGSAPPPAETVAERVVPKSASEYVIPEGVPPQIAEYAHANDMTQQQLDSTLQTFGSYLSNVNVAQKASIREAGEAVVKNWGESASYNKALIKRAIAHTDKNGTLEGILKETGYINHPVVLEHFLSLGQSLKEGGFLKSVRNVPPGQKTPAQRIYSNHPSEQDN